MLFNSIDFAIFLPIVFVVYWMLRRSGIVAQNLCLLTASYIFYGWWSWAFLSLIVVSSVVDYGVGRGLAVSSGVMKRRGLLLLSIVVNLGILGSFKYCNFFIDGFRKAFLIAGHPIEIHNLDIILPVGISFYTFQTMSYTIDVFRRKIEPTRDLVSFFTFVAFFPQLVAGPIERAEHLLPQFQKERYFNRDRASDGLRQFLWGLFKKVVIADGCAPFVDQAFSHYESLSGSVLLVGVILFALQIYGDFSGYSDMAIGSARLFGFELSRNFAFPYFSRHIGEFWRRWHISLTSWFKSYVYFPLGGSRGGRWLTLRNIMIVFVVSGFWHGGKWTFITWGALNAAFFIPLLLAEKNRDYLDTVAQNRLLPSLKECLQMLVTFGLVLVGWVFFRSKTVPDALGYLKAIAKPDLLSWPAHWGEGMAQGPSVYLVTFCLILVLVEWCQRLQLHGLDFSNRKIPLPVRWIIYYALFAVISIFCTKGQDFIYFAF